MWFEKLSRILTNTVHSLNQILIMIETRWQTRYLLDSNAWIKQRKRYKIVVMEKDM